MCLNCGCMRAHDDMGEPAMKRLRPFVAATTADPDHRPTRLTTADPGRAVVASAGHGCPRRLADQDP